MAGGKKSKTVIRSVRITKELDNLLEKDAKAKRVSVNSLISMIMTKYVEMDRYNERFGTITLRREGFRSILEAIEDDRITTLAKEIGSQIGPKSDCTGPIKFLIKIINRKYGLRNHNV